MKFDISLYDRDFFNWHKINVHEVAIVCMDWYIERYNPTSVIDFGAGIGSYLQSAFNHGIKIRGYDISPIAKDFTSPAIMPFMYYKDCTKPINDEKYDTVISFETAEHIEPSGTEQFIQNLVNATGKRLLFTAAPPGQEGTGHINCRPKQFWIDEFSKHLKYNPELSDEIAAIWGLQGAPWYIVNNLIVFER